jgi:hypothetical protein
LLSPSLWRALIQRERIFGEARRRIPSPPEITTSTERLGFKSARAPTYKASPWEIPQASFYVAESKTKNLAD